MILKSIINLSCSFKRSSFSKRYLSISYFRPYKVNMDTMEKNEALVYYNEDKKNLFILFKYIDIKYNLDKIFTFNRNAFENHGVLLKRIQLNIINSIIKAPKKKKKKKSLFPNVENTDLETMDVPVQFIEKNTKEVYDKSTSLSFDILVERYDQYLLKVNETTYSLNFNPPTMDQFDIQSKNIMSGYVLYPKLLQCFNCKLEDVKFTWFKSKILYNSMDDVDFNNLEWEEFGDSFMKLITDDEIGRLLKIVAVPYDGNRKGIKCDSIAKVLVSPGPGKCPFESRHLLTTDLTDNDSLRIVSYNILADLYAHSDYSHKSLFPTCPSYALAIDYRIQLTIKELLGYNGDVLCLQEVDNKVFIKSLQPIFSHYGLAGVFQAKGQKTGEGIAIFYREEKLELIETCEFVLKDELENNPLFIELLNKIKLNENVYNIISQRPNILLACVFGSKTNPKKRLIVGSTHLYFDPLSDHIRIIQASICLNILQQIITMVEIKNPDYDTSLIFSGDFNSSPCNAIYRYMKSQCITDDDPDWTSKPEQHLSGITLSHNMELDSACGTPAYTNYTVGFNGCLDYIFYQADKFKVTQNVPLPTHEEVTAHGALPSVTMPSDHLSLVADLTWIDSPMKEDMEN